MHVIVKIFVHYGTHVEFVIYFFYFCIYVNFFYKLSLRLIENWREIILHKEHHFDQLSIRIIKVKFEEMFSTRLVEIQTGKFLQVLLSFGFIFHICLISKAVAWLKRYGKNCKLNVPITLRLCPYCIPNEFMFRKTRARLR